MRKQGVEIDWKCNFHVGSHTFQKPDIWRLANHQSANLEVNEISVNLSPKSPPTPSSFAMSMSIGDSIMNKLLH